MNKLFKSLAKSAIEIFFALQAPIYVVHGSHVAFARMILRLWLYAQNSTLVAMITQSSHHVRVVDVRFNVHDRMD